MCLLKKSILSSISTITLVGEILAQDKNYIFAVDLIWSGFNLAISGKLRQIISAPTFVRIR